MPLEVEMVDPAVAGATDESDHRAGRSRPRPRHATLHPEALQFDHVRADKLFPVGVMTETEGGADELTDQQDPIQEPESNSLVGYAAIKYTAIVIIVLSILAFLAWYVVPRLP